MEDKVILDERSFKALSANSRVSILKKLTERRMTLTELSKRLNLKGSTIKEHCTILLNAELIKKIDEGRKWKYYELTGKGKQIVAPSFFEEARVLVTLCLGVIIFAGFLIFALQATTSLEGASYSQGSNTFFTGDNATIEIGDSPKASGSITSDTTTATQENEINKTVDENIPAKKNTYVKGSVQNVALPFTLIGMLIIGIIIGWVARKKL